MVKSNWIKATLADIGFTGGGRGTHQVYLGGEVAHRLLEGDQSIVDHLVKLVEEKAALIAKSTENKDAA